MLVIAADGTLATVSLLDLRGRARRDVRRERAHHPASRGRALRDVWWARRLDHATIFVFIAASYLPFALLRFHGSTRWLVLVLVWAGAALGLVLELAWIDSPRWLKAIAYMAVGWVGVIVVPEVFSAVGL